MEVGLEDQDPCLEEDRNRLALCHSIQAVEDHHGNLPGDRTHPSVGRIRLLARSRLVGDRSHAEEGHSHLCLSCSEVEGLHVRQICSILDFLANFAV